MRCSLMIFFVRGLTLTDILTLGSRTLGLPAPSLFPPLPFLALVSSFMLSYKSVCALK